jgi:hypothetical protein
MGIRMMNMPLFRAPDIAGKRLTFVKAGWCDEGYDEVWIGNELGFVDENTAHSMGWWIRFVDKAIKDFGF